MIRSPQNTSEDEERSRFRDLDAQWKAQSPRYDWPKLVAEDVLDNPIAFDSVVLEYQSSLSTPCLDQVFAHLREDLLDDDSIASAATELIDPAILFRQSWPAVVAALIDGQDPRLVAELIAGYAFWIVGPVQVLDQVVDGVLGSDAKLPVLNDTEVCIPDVWMLASLQEKAGVAWLLDRCHAALHEIAPLTQHMLTAMAMNDTKASRFNLRHLENPHIVLGDYERATARDTASIFNESMLLGGLAHLGHEPDQLDQYRVIARRQRTLRQRVDECADLVEDILAGFVTRPWALALAHAGSSSSLAEQIKCIWESDLPCQRGPITLGEESHAQRCAYLVREPRIQLLMDELMSTGVLFDLFDALKGECHDILHDITRLPSARGQFELGLITLLKRAFLERIKCYNWLPHVVESKAISGIRRRYNSQDSRYR